MYDRVKNDLIDNGFDELYYTGLQVFKFSEGCVTSSKLEVYDLWIVQWSLNIELT